MRKLSGSDHSSDGTSGGGHEVSPGKRNRTQSIQRRRAPAAADSDGGGSGPTASGGGSGTALPGPVQAKMEDAFDFNFSQVRVHEGAEASAMGAVAYTQGADVHFAPGQYDPGSAGGQELIGHELAHVVQQGEGRVAPTTQFKGVEGNDDGGLEREADDWGARAARGERVRSSDGTSGAGIGAVAQQKVVQKKDPPAGVVAAAHTFSVPPVVNIGAIRDPVNRNQAINQSYHAIDAAMTGYLGDPLVSNWYTYGQHASREAGTQIRNLQHGMQVLNDALPILLGFGSGNLLAIFGQAQAAVATIKRILDLMGQDLLLEQSINLALAKAGITKADLNQIVTDAATVLATAPIAGLFPPLAAVAFLRFIGHLSGLVAKLIVAIPAIIDSLKLVLANMVKGNREIYENVAPAAHAFLQAAQGAPDGVPQGVAFASDPSGFLAAAFGEYAECRKLGDEARALPADDPQRAAKLSQRQGKAHHANLVIGMQEQLVILQPIFDTMMAELTAMSGTMVLHDPNGAHPLASNWGDFYTRMGIDPARAPRDPRTITAGTLPPLLPKSQRVGTISEYFEDGLPGARANLTDEKIHEAPTAIAPI